jgi:hypothetical protein
MKGPLAPLPVNNRFAVPVLITATASKYSSARVKDHPRRVVPTLRGTDDTTQSGELPSSAGELANKLLKDSFWN